MLKGGIKFDFLMKIKLAFLQKFILDFYQQLLNRDFYFKHDVTAKLQDLIIASETRLAEEVKSAISYVGNRSSN